MGNVIHFDEKYKQALLEGFGKASETDDLFDHSLDMEFSGVKTVHVKSLKTEPLQDYDRNLQVGTGSRYGQTKEVGNEEQTFTMTQDRSLSLSVDKGNNMETMDKHKVGAIMKAEREEHIIPEVDTYRLRKWAENGGMHVELAAKPTSDNILEMIIKARNSQRNRGVKSDVTLLIPYQYLDTLQLAKQWVNLDSLGGKHLPKGTVGQIAGMNVKPVSDDRMPANAVFIILCKKSVISPMKIKDFKGHVDPPGLSGDLLEFRMIYDAFVLGKKADGVLVGCLPGTVAAVPTIAVASGKATITSTGATAIYYTLDGSDPRYSVEAKAYTAAVALTEGDQIRAYATADGKFHSGVAASDYTAG
jgi:hypothetical protein